MAARSPMGQFANWKIQSRLVPDGDVHVHLTAQDDFYFECVRTRPFQKLGHFPAFTTRMRCHRRGSLATFAVGRTTGSDVPRTSS